MAGHSLDLEAWRKCGDHQVAGGGGTAKVPAPRPCSLLEGLEQSPSKAPANPGVESKAGGGAETCGRGSQLEWGGVPTRGEAAEGREPLLVPGLRGGAQGPRGSAEEGPPSGDQRVPAGRRESLLCLWTQQLPGSERASGQFLGTRFL